MQRLAQRLRNQKALKTLFLCGFSVGPDGSVALLPREFIQRLIEGNKAGVCGLREGQQPAITDPLRGGLGGEEFGGLPEAGFCLPGLGTEFHAWIFEPLVVDGPRLAQRECLFAHHRIVGEQAQ